MRRRGSTACWRVAYRPSGAIRLAPMLNEAGRLMGDLTRRAPRRRPLLAHRLLLPAGMAPALVPLSSCRRAGVTLTNITDEWMGFSVSGPASREILAELAHDDVSNEAFGFLGVRSMDVGLRPGGGRTHLAHRRARLRDRRAGEPAPHALARATGRGHDARPAAHRRPCDRQPPAGEGLRHLVGGVPTGLHARYERARSVRRVRQGRVHGSRRRAPRPRGRSLHSGSCCSRSTPTDADASADEGIWIGDRRVGFVTSGAYGHHVGMSLALAYVDRDVAESSARAHGVRRGRAERPRASCPRSPTTRRAPSSATSQPDPRRLTRPSLMVVRSFCEPRLPVKFVSYPLLLGSGREGYRCAVTLCTRTGHTIRRSMHLLDTGEPAPTMPSSPIPWPVSRSSFRARSPG